jgi:hypothetical protein
LTHSVADPEDVVDVVADLAGRIKAALPEVPDQTEPHAITVVLEVDGELRIAVAATEAVRGYVQCAALDLARAGRRCNLVLADRSSDPVDVESAMTYLESTAGATAVGMTVDLRRT